MGRHTAADGAASHPLVEAALAGRAADVPGAHRGSPQGAAEEGDLGWPGDPDRQGGGLGWPGDADGATPGAEPDGSTPARPRRGWRRLFGAARAA
ncbi:hypothetical protein [Blastococcus sp. VKM Ac-2987]|uniref:hypothetical protein n=1 Tax=Blastococcus sp. VKM Ac-2987 TaxID=3004141 RepID=UPI0022ABA867|nr:hypothetical protein [Blastococcus sp. VKM Ac-2987]MCZ2859343.1 hypothetical protein [Blastococcus sp. VKM Ac-2987]